MTASASSESKAIETKTNLGTKQNVGPLVGLAQLNYYIHDSIDSCRLQFFGVLRNTDLAELKGCWETARTTLGTRNLVLDMRSLKSADEAGKNWLLSMRDEGAVCLPADYFHAGRLETQLSEPGARGRIGVLSKLLSILRGSRNLPVESSTQAQ